MIQNPNTYNTLISIVNKEAISNDDESIKKKEEAILELGAMYAKEKKADDLLSLIHQTRPFLNQISKAKAAKIVKTLVDCYLDIEAATGKEVQLCLECIDWARQENRTFLRQALEVRLIALYFDTKDYENALTLGATLLKELKKLDDKALLVEVQLLESKVYHALSNLPRARAALTSARTTANGIYCPPKLQAALDLQSGILHAADERDFKTAYSYFYEAFEGYDSVDNPRAIIALKYMALSMIMLNKANEVGGILGGKLALKYTGEAIDAMKSIADASFKRSLADFNQTTARYKSQLEEDTIVGAHLNTLYDSLLEQNLCRIIEPYSRVQVLHVAKLINLPIDVVEKKLSQMILDKKFHGVLDQGTGVLIIFDELCVDKTYGSVLESIQSMGKVVDSLYNKAKKLT